MSKKRKNIAMLTQEEINNIFKISGVDRTCFEFTERELSKEDYKSIVGKKGILGDENINIRKQPKRGLYFDYIASSHAGSLEMLEEGIIIGVSPKSPIEIPNAFKVAQYLIDQGYRFDYDLKAKS